MNAIKKIKDKAYHYFAVKNYGVRREFPCYIKMNSKDPRWKRWIALIRLNWHYRIRREKTYLFPECIPTENDLYYVKERMNQEELYKQIEAYDVISFDIFDTIVYRKVEKPTGIFRIMAQEMGRADFMSIRAQSSSEATQNAYRNERRKEVRLEEIYDCLEKRYGIERKWMDREIELEIEMSMPNSYMREIYQRLINEGKHVVFMSDMYLPMSVIKELLHKNGYDRYDRIYLSSELGVRKREGDLQRVLLKDWPDKKIVHLGDNYHNDINMSKKAGLDAIHVLDSGCKARESEMDNIAGSVYRAIVNTQMNNGTWNHDLFYSHGYRVGGIMLMGYCQYIEKLAQEKKIDKILFCARDCEVIWKAYNKFFGKVDNEYIETSRYALLNVSSAEYFYDLANRCIVRYMETFKTQKTIGTILEECGYEYLIAQLEKHQISRYLFPAQIQMREIKEFIFDCKEQIAEHNQNAKAAACQYFNDLIGNASNVLVVDVGWSGSSVVQIENFVRTNMPEKGCRIYGALLCTSRNETLTSSMEQGLIHAYGYSVFENQDLAKLMMPSEPEWKDQRKQDIRHLALEYLFTSVKPTLLSYQMDQQGKVSFVHRKMMAKNKDEIVAMQKGMLDFAETYFEFIKPLKYTPFISSYVALNPLFAALKHENYLKAVYGNFEYDTSSLLFAEDESTETYEGLFPIDIQSQDVQRKEEKKQILFITPELSYTGTPRSMLRMCNVALKLGYDVTVWSAKPGPFVKEYEKSGISVKIVPEKSLNNKGIIRQIQSFDMAVCNTIVTDKYERVCSQYIPTVWYIREATNIPDFIKGKWECKYTLENSKNICCVSDYAANAIKKYTSHPIRVIHNCVEDEREMAQHYRNGTADRIRFVQFGTMEYRKGYDVLLAAYLAMPEAYRNQAELYFAGGFIMSGAPYCTYLFHQIDKHPNVHYLGVVRGEQNKIRTLSDKDVVVVASRDESCSLVALEGAMLSKPLIVTENVGAKYMVSPQNGFVVKTGDVEDLKNAMIRMIDQRDRLQEMGEVSRKRYEDLANMDIYEASLEKLFKELSNKKYDRFSKDRIYAKNAYQKSRMEKEKRKKLARNTSRETEKVIISLTSYPGRMSVISTCIRSLLKQNRKPEKILLWLAKEQYPNGIKDLPEELVRLERKNAHFEIRWAEEDLKPHKKYFYTMQEYPDYPVITVDDDVVYDPDLVGCLMDSYRKFPNCVSAMRANMIMFKENGEPFDYKGWIQGFGFLRDIPCHQLLPTGVGGVLYPPHAIAEAGFDMDAIKETCLHTDDLWLKVFCTHRGLAVVVPDAELVLQVIKEAQNNALYFDNVFHGCNDESLRKILDFYDRAIGNSRDILNTWYTDRYC